MKLYEKHTLLVSLLLCTFDELFFPKSYVIISYYAHKHLKPQIYAGSRTTVQRFSNFPSTKKVNVNA